LQISRNSAVCPSVVLRQSKRSALGAGGQGSEEIAGCDAAPDIGSAFVCRDKQQQVGSAIDVRKAILWQMAAQADTIGDPALAGERLDRGALRPLADDDKINPREPDERLNHPMTLQNLQLHASKDLIDEASVA
jgi:hypothetical protein